MAPVPKEAPGADYFFGVEPCDVDKVYGPGLVKERLSKASIAD